MINLIIVYSQIEDQTSVKDRTRGLLKRLLDEINDLNFLGYFNDSEDFLNKLNSKKEFEKSTIIINSSGGTEDIIDAVTKRLLLPILIVADSKRNSFASALESYSYLKDNYPIKLFYAENDEQKFDEIQKFVTVANTIEVINNTHFGLIGSPSDWLLTSRGFEGFGNFKTRLTSFDVKQLVNYFNEINGEDVEQIKNEWEEDYNEILVNDKSLVDSAKAYLALKKIINENKLNVVSIRCFDLLKYNFTACMGLSVFNDGGITAGCEGDIPTTFTMLIAQELTGSPVWMANPSSINRDKNQITFAHCTVPSKFLSDKSKAGLTTHMESGKSTAIRGPLKSSEVTIMRISKEFDKITAVSGKIIESDMQEENLCRTQAVISIDSNVDKWIESALGNHQVIVYGNILEELKYFCDFTDVELQQLNLNN